MRAPLVLALALLPVVALSAAAPAGGEPHRHPPGPPVIPLPALARQPDTHIFARGVRRRPVKLALPRLVGPRDVAATVMATLTRDLRMSGLFEVVDGEGLAGIDVGKETFDTIDPKVWGRRGIEAVLKATALALDDGRVHLELRLFFPPHDRPPTVAAPVMRSSFDVPRVELRAVAHRAGNGIAQELTGTPASFGTRLVFDASVGRGQKWLYRIDADGENLEHLPTVTNVALSPVYGPGHDIFYAAARPDGSSSLHRLGHDEAVLTGPGRILGAAFGGTRMALVSADAGGSDIWVGNADGTSLRKLTSGGINTHPAWGPRGELAYVSTRSGNPQVYVDGRRVSTRGTFNTAPTWCNDPEGVKLVFMGRDGTGWDIFSVDPAGGPSTMVRLTDSAGSNMYPACSPDGRQVAFFSTRPEGSGLYLMTVHGTNVERIEAKTGESLRWETN